MPAFDAFRQDVHDAWRSVRRSPGFTITAVLVLAAALAVNAGVFSLINVLIFRPLPVHKPEELAFIYRPLSTEHQFAAPVFGDYREFVETQNVFSGVLATSGGQTRFRRGGESRVVRGELVSGNYFSVLGVSPMLGRTFSSEETESSGGVPVMMISERLWRSSFNADRDLLGQTLDLDFGRAGIGYYGRTRAYQIIGVMGAEFDGLSPAWEPTDFWVPLTQRAGDQWADTPPTVAGRPVDPVASRPVSLVGRLKPGVSFEHARVAVHHFGQQLVRDRLARWPDNSEARALRQSFSLTLEDRMRVRLPFDARGTVVPARFAATVAAVSACLLFVAIANLVGLLRARGVAREPEIAVRLTLGASRWRVARQMLTESLIVATAGGLLGLVVSRWIVRAVLLNTPTTIGGMNVHRFALEVPLDWRVLGFSFAACVLVGVITGLAPARQAWRTNVLAGMTATSMSSSRHARRRLRHWVAVPQLAASLVLLVIGGSLLRALLGAQSTTPGYRADNVVVLNFERPARTAVDRPVQTAEQRDAWETTLRTSNQRLLEAAGPAAGVSTASLMLDGSLLGLPFAGSKAWAIARDQFTANRHFWISRAGVGPGYFDTLQIPLRRGRNFDTRDGVGTARVVIVDETLAMWMWQGENPIGRYIGFHQPNAPTPPEWLEVVGVVGAVTPPLASQPVPAAYTAFAQTGQYANTILARGHEPPATLIRKLSAAIHQSDGATVVSLARTMEEAEDAVLFTRRFAVGLVGVSGITALLLAALGLYGVMSYSVAQRFQEIGIRAALGASRLDLVRLILREGAAVGVIGCAIGLPLTLGAARIAKSVVVAMAPLDGATSAIVCAVVLAVVLIACYIPARRASRADPMTVLRQL